MKTNPLITVLMTAYNSQKTIGTAIECILNQTYTDFEFIIVNDGSTDNTREAVLSYNDPRIRVINLPENAGIGAASNIGLKHANGVFIARHDSDDTCVPDRLALQLETLENSGLNVCFSYALFYNLVTGKQSIWKEKLDWNYTIWQGLFDNSYGPHNSLFIRRDTICSIGGYNSKFRCACDYELYDRLVYNREKFVFVPETLVTYYLNRNSVSSFRNTEQSNNARIVSERAIKQLIPAISSNELDGLYWLFSEQTHNQPVITKDALQQCSRLANSFEAYHGIQPDCQRVWYFIGRRIAMRYKELKTSQDRSLARELILKSIVKTKSSKLMMSCISKLTR